MWDELAEDALRVAVLGRRAVGRRTVARALRRAGVAVTGPGRADAADVAVYVLAEVRKPEDDAATAALVAARRPMLTVWNKADVAEPGPEATATMVGLLAVADLDDELWAALGVLAGGGRVSPQVHGRLGDTLDEFGIAAALSAIRGGAGRAEVTARLRELSGVDAVCERIAAAGAELTYRRLADRITGLAARAVGDAGLAELLSDDAVVFARERAARRALDAAGFAVCAPRPAGALAWRRYSRVPVSSVYQDCAADVVRASLRRLGSAGTRCPP